MKRIGIYAGTFDPVHMGHVSFGLTAKNELQLDIIIFIPESAPRHKTAVTDLEHRLSMLQLTLASYPGLKSMVLESAQFTIEKTLPELERHFPDASFTFLIGSDIVPTLSQWPGIEKLIQNATLAIGIRSGVEQPTLERYLQELERITGISVARHYLTTRHEDARSSDIRAGRRPIYNPQAARYATLKNLYEHKK